MTHIELHTRVRIALQIRNDLRFDMREEREREFRRINEEELEGGEIVQA